MVEAGASLADAPLPPPTAPRLTHAGLFQRLDPRPDVVAHLLVEDAVLCRAVDNVLARRAGAVSAAGDERLARALVVVLVGALGGEGEARGAAERGCWPHGGRDGVDGGRALEARNA